MNHLRKCFYEPVPQKTDKTVHRREDHIFAGPDLTPCFLQNYRVGSGFIETFR